MGMYHALLATLLFEPVRKYGHPAQKLSSDSLKELWNACTLIVSHAVMICSRLKYAEARSRKDKQRVSQSLPRLLPEQP